MNEKTHPHRTLIDDLQHWAQVRPGEPWLVEQWPGNQREVSFAQGAAEVQAAAAWLARNASERGARIGLLANNCAHWMLADCAIMASGNATVPFFTTMDADTVNYGADFAGVEMLFVGRGANWNAVGTAFKTGTTVVTLPGAPAFGDEPEYGKGDYIGVGSCANGACHGASQPMAV